MYMRPYLIKNNTDDYDYNINQMYEDLDKINFNQTGDSIKKFMVLVVILIFLNVNY